MLLTSTNKNAKKKLGKYSATLTHLARLVNNVNTAYVVVQFYPWFNFYFPLSLGMVMYDNEFRTKENNN